MVWNESWAHCDSHFIGKIQSEFFNLNTFILSWIHWFGAIYREIKSEMSFHIWYGLAGLIFASKLNEEF